MKLIGKTILIGMIYETARYGARKATLRFLRYWWEQGH